MWVGNGAKYSGRMEGIFFYLMINMTYFVYGYMALDIWLRIIFLEWKEGNVLFNDALNTFYLRLYGVRHMVNTIQIAREETCCRHMGYSL